MYFAYDVVLYYWVCLRSITLYNGHFLLLLFNLSGISENLDQKYILQTIQQPNGIFVDVNGIFF